MSSTTTPSHRPEHKKQRRMRQLKKQPAPTAQLVQHGPTSHDLEAPGRKTTTSSPDAMSPQPGEIRKTKRKGSTQKPRKSKNDQTNCNGLDRDLARISLRFETRRSKPNKKARQHQPRLPTNRRLKSPFLALPAEIRNHIYSYVIPSARILIHGNAPNRELAALKGLWENEGQYVKRPRYRLGHMLDNSDIQDDIMVSPSLLFVCRKTKKEVELFMYSRLTFCFDSMMVVHKFLNVASIQGIKEIRSLELSNFGHGQPRYTTHLDQKVKHDRKWRQTCERIATEMPSLNSLKLQMSIHDWPVTLTEKDHWFKTTMTLLPRGPLHFVEIRLRHPRFSNEKMSEASRRLEDCMMSEQGKNARDEKEANEAIRRYYEAESERRARLALLPPVQAKRILSIVAELTPPEATKKYYTSHTERYAKDYDAIPKEWCW